MTLTVAVVEFPPAEEKHFRGLERKVLPAVQFAMSGLQDNIM